MQPRVLIGLGALAIALVAAAALVLSPTNGERPDPGAPPEAPRPTPSSSPGPRSPRTLGDAIEALAQPREPQIQLPPAEARREAEASFEHIMQTLEELADAGKRVPAARRDELYRNTNDAFSALSATLDPNSAADMQALEDANIRMKSMLHELGVRVPRRPPLALEDPRAPAD